MAGYLYILQSERSGRYYAGSTCYPDRRLSQHNSNSVCATRGKGPWVRAALIAFADEATARRAEAYIKRQKSRRLIELVVAGGFAWPPDREPVTR